MLFLTLTGRKELQKEGVMKFRYGVLVMGLPYTLRSVLTSPVSVALPTNSIHGKDKQRQAETDQVSIERR